MKIGAVIAEYNPFHKGHLYQIEEMKKLGADAIIVLLSGDFTQRGIPALLDKHTRAKLCLENGADLVLELPVFFATGSAEYFARGAVSILEQLGCVDFLHFGSESGNLSALQTCAHLFLTEPTSFKEQLTVFLKQGYSFPKARSMALSTYMNINSETDKEEKNTLESLCSQPNNILAIEYLKELERCQSSIQPITIVRKGSGYSETALPKSSENSFASANAIRSVLENHQFSTLSAFVPENVADCLSKSSNVPMLFENDFSGVLLYKLMAEVSGFDCYYDVSKQLSDIIQKNLFSYTDWKDFALSCKSKELTYTRINRSLLHILLNMKQDTMEQLKSAPDALYARVLGFSANTSVLKVIKGNTSIPLITKLANASKTLSPNALCSLEADIHAANIYQSVKAQKYHTTPANEYRIPIVSPR